MDRYDALLLVSFGGPEGPRDVIPFLENVTRGRGVPPERLAEVAAHYQLFDGVSPINEQNRALLAALRAELDPMPVYWGNRNWHPLLADTLREMASDGVRSALAFVTSSAGSFSGCRQYLDDIEAARSQAGPAAPAVDKLRLFYNHPGFVEPMADRVREAREALGDPRPALVFTAHSVPLSMARTGPYVEQLTEAARLVAERAAPDLDWALVWQSRSGPPAVPWLEPDICEHLEQLHARGSDAAVLVPIGFLSDHVEVRYDLDVEARERADALGMRLRRAATVGADPAFASMVAELVAERTVDAPRRALGALGVWPDSCPEGCCPAPVRPGRPATQVRDPARS